jgi:hypothetical protein
VGFVAVGQVGLQRAEGTDLYCTGVNRRAGKGAQRSNGWAESPRGCRSDRPGVLTLPRRFRKGTIAVEEQKVVVKRRLLSAEVAGVAWSFEP